MEVIGINAILHRSATELADVTDVTINAATWLVVEDAGDVNVDDNAAEGNATRRRHGGNRMTIPTERDATITFNFILDKATPDSLTDFEAFETSYQAKTGLALAVMDGPIGTAGSRGFVGNFCITRFEEDQTLNEPITYNVTARLRGFGKRFKKA